MSQDVATKLAVGWTAPKRNRWKLPDGRRLVQAWHNSGLSKSAFARKHGLTNQRIDYWQKRCADADVDVSSPEPALFVPVSLKPSPAVLADIGPATGAHLRITTASGAKIEVSRGFDPDVLQQLIASLDGEMQ